MYSLMQVFKASLIEAALQKLLGAVLWYLALNMTKYLFFRITVTTQKYSKGEFVILIKNNTV